MDERWLQHYDENVPRAIDEYPDKTLVDFIAQHSSQHPDSIAVAFKGRHLTFRQIDELSDAFANGLASIGVKRGERIAFILLNVPQFVIAELAAWKIGAVVVPFSPLYTERELEEALKTTEPQYALVLTPFYAKMKSVQPRSSVKRVIATNVKEYLPPVLRVLFTLAKEKKEGHRIALQAGDAWFQDLVVAGTKLPEPVSLAKPDDPAVILMSGGTTGSPKGVLNRHRNLVMAGTQLSAWLNEPLAGANASIMLPLPLFHTYGCAGAQSMTIIGGIPLILVPNPRDVGDLLATINREKPALFCGVPPMFNAMLNHPDVIKGKIDFRSIKACFSGAGALMAETKTRFENLTGGRIVEGYSLTEAAMACCVNPYKGTNKVGSIGMPVCGVRVRIVDQERGIKDLAPGETGEVILQAPQLMEGYWNNPKETAIVLREHADGRWLYTGDLGYMDEDGYIFLVDRKKDLIKTSGFQVWPREIEEVIASHPAVLEVGVAGVPDVKQGEAVRAWVVPRSGATVDEETIRTWCRGKLSPYKVPSKVEIRTELPKTLVGKVLRRVLVEQAKSSS